MRLLALFLLISLYFGPSSVYSAPSLETSEKIDVYKESSIKEKLHNQIKNHTVLSQYNEAKRVLFAKIYLEQNSSGYFVTDVYCNKEFTEADGVGEEKIPDHTKVNCEHTWPQSRFSKNFSKKYQKNDLHHLYHSDSRANSSRGAIKFAEVDGAPVNETCMNSLRGHDLRSDMTAFEPPNEHKGNVARALFYFSIRYKLPIDDREEFHLRNWNESDPVDEMEERRNNIIFKIQGNRNPFIDNSKLASQIQDF